MREIAKLRRKHRLTEGSLASKATLVEVGLAPHVSHGPITLGIVDACFAGIRERLSTHAWRDAGQLAILDGWLLARLLVPPPRADAKASRKPAASTRLAKRIGSSGRALLAGPLAREVAPLIAEYTERMRAGEHALVREGFANCVAAGILLYGFEYDLEGAPRFAHLAPGKASRSTTGPVKHVAIPPDLLEAVLAAPRDDAPRLVLGDWLCERGDPRGEFIQVQCALARREGDVEALRAREQALLKAHERRWLEPVRGSIRQWRFERGFVHSVVTDMARFLSARVELARVPLRHAKLTGYKAPLLETVRKARPLATLRGIDLSTSALAPCTLDVLEAPLFASLAALDLASNRFGDAGVDALLPVLPAKLTRLGLASTRITNEGVARLARSPRFAELTHLRLDWNPGIDDGAIASLSGARQLEWLVLPSNGLTSAGLARLALPRLTHLLLTGGPIDGLEVLLDNERLPALRAVAAPHDTSTAVLSRLDTRFVGKASYDLFDDLV